jgi:hypothetical protein
LEDLKAWKFLNGFGTRKHPRGFPQFVNRTACVFPFYGSHECTVKRQACTYLASGDIKCEDKWLQTGYNNILQNEKNKTVPMADAMTFLRPF